MTFFSITLPIILIQLHHSSSRTLSPLTSYFLSLFCLNANGLWEDIVVFYEIVQFIISFFVRPEEGELP